MKKIKYGQKVSIHYSASPEIKHKIKQRAVDLALSTGWNPETGEGGKGPIMSGVIDELVVIGFVVLELFGEDWEDHLKVQSEPIWAKQQQQKLNEVWDYLKKMEFMTSTDKVAAIEKIETGWDMEEGMLE